MAVGQLLLQIDIFIDQPLGRVSVHVDDDGAAMN
jgi:hypothetical protein